jgi:hypothetical protein
MAIPKRQPYRWYVRRKQGYWQSLNHIGTGLAPSALVLPERI